VHYSLIHFHSLKISAIDRVVNPDGTRPRFLMAKHLQF
jgi:hypothetical protein